VRRDSVVRPHSGSASPDRHPAQLADFDDPDRDERRWVLSVAHVAVIPYAVPAGGGLTDPDRVRGSPSASCATSTKPSPEPRFRKTPSGELWNPTFREPAPCPPAPSAAPHNGSAAPDKAARFRVVTNTGRRTFAGRDVKSIVTSEGRSEDYEVGLDDCAGFGAGAGLIVTDGIGAGGPTVEPGWPPV